MADAKQLIGELIRLSYRLSYDEKETWKRVRYAVSPAEWERIRRYLDCAGWPKLMAIRGIPLVLEGDPTHPDIKLEID